MTKPDLAALSAAATQGEWRYRPMPYDDWGVVKSSPIDGYSYVLAQFRDPRRDDEETLNQHRRDKTDPWGDNAQFVCALVNEYRAGRLVHIDEGMRERVARAIDHELVWSVETDVLASSLTREEQLKVADAAIAAMKGGAK